MFNQRNYVYCFLYGSPKFYLAPPAVGCHWPKTFQNYIPGIFTTRKFAKVMFSQVSVCPQGGTRTVKSGRYASYWNAFLSYKVLLFAVWIQSDITTGTFTQFITTLSQFEMTVTFRQSLSKITRFPAKWRCFFVNLKIYLLHSNL